MAGPGKADESETSAGWRGKSVSRKTLERRGWQVDREANHIRLTHRRQRWRRMSFALLLLIGFIGGAAFLAALQQREGQIPFVTIVKTDYSHVFPPNSWSQDDLASLRTGGDALDRKTINIVDLSDFHATDGSLFNSPELRQQSLRRAERTGAIVFYVSMHGLVNDLGQACVASADAAPHDATTWLPVSALLAQIQNCGFSDDVHKLLILDCNRYGSNWKIGQLENDFAARLQQAYEESPVANLVILNSTSPGQIGYPSAELGGTVFGQFLRLGLAGVADLAEEEGDGNGLVSLVELHHYLVKHVDRWVADNRGARQQPLLIPSRPTNFRLTCSLGRSRINSLLAKTANGVAPEGAVPRKQIDELWSAFRELSDEHADSFAPLEMGEFRRQLIWLEQASQAGDAYRQEAHAAEGELKRLSSRLRQRFDRKVSGEFQNQGPWKYPDVSERGLSPQLHSIPLLARASQIDPSTVDEILANLRRLTLESTIEELDGLPGNSQEEPRAYSLGIVHFLKLFSRSREWRRAANIGGGIIESVVDLHTLSERAAVPGDPRTMNWIRRETDSVDAVRNRCDDSLLTGTFQRELYETAKSGYGQILNIDASARQAFELTDRVISELPDLIRWLEREEGAETRPQTMGDIFELISAMHRLVNTLDEGSTASEVRDTNDLAFAPYYQTLFVQYQNLRRRFDEECERLTDSADLSPSFVRRAAAVLELPLLSSKVAENGMTPLEQRQRIQENYTQAVGALHRRSVAGLLHSNDQDNSKRSPQNDGEDQSVPPSTTNTGPIVHRYPLLALLEPLSPASAVNQAAPDAGGIAENSVVAGTQIRRILKALPADIEASRERHLTSPDRPFQEWSRASRLGRVCAPLMASTLPVDPVTEMRRLQIQQIFLWNAKRYLDSFWGPSSPHESPFFQSAATDSIEVARMVCMPNPATDKQIFALNALLSKRQKAAESGLTVQAEDVLIVEALNQPTSRLSVTRPIPGSGEGLPDGTGMLRITDQKGSLIGPIVDFSMASNGLPSDTNSQVFKLPVQTAADDVSGTVGAATAYFRGHEFSDALVVNQGAGTTVETRIVPNQTARIRLNGSKRQKAAIVFVLDCSASMQKGMPFEAAESKVTRMDVARAALVRMLNVLAARGNARVGVLLYGHRVGWSVKQPNQLMTQPNLGGTLPDGLKPYEDVETILPLGRFDSIAAGKVSQYLEKVKPWGETPLYLAITQAVLEFKDDDPDVQRSVVVITDGVNYQFNPRPEMAKSAQDVLTAGASRRSTLNIVGFGIQASEAQEAQREFSRLAKATGGEYVTVNEAAALAETLEGILQRQTYSVTSASGQISRAPLGTAIDLSWEEAEPQSFRIVADAAEETVEFTGGEAAELFVDPESRSVISATYGAGAPIFGPLVGGSAKQSEGNGVRLGVHLPIHDGSAVTFDLSLQQIQQRFVRRPNEVWIEITPILSEKRVAVPQKYVIYDPEFVAQTPVPVLRATARDWPKEALRARIEFWCKWTSTEPSLQIPFSELPDPDRPSNAGSTIDGIRGLTYQVRRKQGSPFRIDFIENYSAESSGESQLKVDIIGRFLPSRTMHQFDEANRFAAHSFFFDQTPQTLLNNLQMIRIISRRRMLDDAWHLEVPMFIEIPSQSETLPPSP